MKSSLFPWWLLVLAAVLCALFSAAYFTLHVPHWISIYAAVSSALLFWFGLEVRRAPIHPDEVYEYGTCNKRRARRHRETGEVQFIMWQKGQRQGNYVYPEDSWLAFSSYWYPDFTPGPAPAISAESAAAHASPACAR